MVRNKKGLGLTHICSRCDQKGIEYARDCDPSQEGGCRPCKRDGKMCPKTNPGKSSKQAPRPAVREQPAAKDPNVDPPSHAFREGFEQGFQSGFRQALHLFMPGYSEQDHSDPGPELDLPSEHSEQSGNRAFLNSLLRLTQRMQAVDREGDEQQPRLQQIVQSQQRLPTNEQHRASVTKRKRDDDPELYVIPQQRAKKTRCEATTGPLSPVDLTSDHQAAPPEQQQYAIVKYDDNHQKSSATSGQEAAPPYQQQHALIKSDDTAFRSLFHSGGFHTQSDSTVNATRAIEATGPPESCTGEEADNFTLSGCSPIADPDASSCTKSASSEAFEGYLTHPAMNYGEAEAAAWNDNSSMGSSNHKPNDQTSYTIGSVVDPLRDPRIRPQVESAQASSIDTGGKVDGEGGYKVAIPERDPQD